MSRPSLDLCRLQSHWFALALRELYRLAVLLERLKRFRIAAIDFRAGRKCINVVFARPDPLDLAGPIGLRPAFGEQGSLPLSRHVRRDEDAGAGHWLAVVIFHRAFRSAAVCLQNDVE